MVADPNLTQLLNQLHEAEGEASVKVLDEIVPVLYDELRTLAHAQLRNERSDHTLNTTALVNEAYLRLVGHDRLSAETRVQFFRVAVTTMRRILVDYARARNQLKRGGGEQQRVPLEKAALMSERTADEMLAIDAALDRLEAINPRGSQVVQHRFFAGLTLEETAEAMDLSVPTVHRAWRAARNWLRKEIAQDVTGL